MDSEPAFVSTPSRRGGRGAARRGTPDDKGRAAATMSARGGGTHKEKYRRLLDQFETDKVTKEQRTRELAAVEDKERRIQGEIDALLDAIAAEAHVTQDPLLLHFAGSEDPNDLSFLMDHPFRREPREVHADVAFNEYFARDERGIIPRVHHHVIVNGHHTPGQ